VLTKVIILNKLGHILIKSGLENNNALKTVKRWLFIKNWDRTKKKSIKSGMEILWSRGWLAVVTGMKKLMTMQNRNSRTHKKRYAKHCM